MRKQYQLLLAELIKLGNQLNAPQLSTIRLIIDKLNRNEDEVNLDEIRQINDGLYPPRGGLGEYYIWDDDYETRMGLNEPIDKAKAITWEILTKE
ncbi:hypothetical protein [uncultured Vagococcus sp.]|uniref:hypothetical protein n=1 Tax=uncultured Vagococcus sp. TaxID=189676 RepID=UPI0028D71B34|nr:hypothetical protein [uncultured Vagococcus sp.]